METSTKRQHCISVGIGREFGMRAHHINEPRHFKTGPEDERPRAYLLLQGFYLRSTAELGGA